MPTLQQTQGNFQVTALTNAPRHAPASASTTPRAEGSKIASSYILRRQLLASGDDVIWLAHDEVLGKDVTLHFIPEAVHADARAIETLRQEIKRYRQLIHPQILRVYDLVEEAGCAAIVMDAFNGTPLSALLAGAAGGKLDPADLRPWLGALCRTLDDAHKIKLVHRDLSPVNLIVDGQRQIIVAKFGISRFIRDTLDRSRDRQGPDAYLAYASPQQLDGERPAVSDDVYAFGVLLWELLTGQPPFSGKDLVAQIRRKVPGSIAQRRAELKRNGATIPASWEKVVSACLEKSIERRPASMLDIAARLELEPAPAVLGDAVSGATVSAPTSRAAAAVPPRVSTISRPLPPAQPPSSGTDPASAHSSKPVEMVGRPKRTSPFETQVAAKAPVPGDSPARSKIESKFVKSELDAVAAAARIDQKSLGTRKTAAVPPPFAATARSAKKNETLSDAVPSEVPDDYPGFELRRSNFPLTTLAAAAIVIMIGMYGLFFMGPSAVESGPQHLTGFDLKSGEALSGEPGGAGGAELPPVNERTIDPIPAAHSTLLIAAPAPEEKSAPPEDPAPAAADAATTLAAAPKDPEPISGEAVQAAPPENAPISAAARPAPDKSRTAAADAEVAAKTAALEKAQKEAEAAEKTRQEMLKAKEEAEAKMAVAQKTFEEKTKAAVPMLKAAEEATALQKTREEEMRAAEVAAQQAQQVAIEKARIADEAKKTFAAVEKETKEKSAVQQKTEAELKELQAGVEERRKSAAEVAKAAADANARFEELTAMIKRSEQELAEAKVAAQKAAEEAARMAAERRKKIEAEIAEARAAFERKIAELESALKSSEATGPPAAAASPGALDAPPPPPPRRRNRKVRRLRSIPFRFRRPPSPRRNRARPCSH